MSEAIHAAQLALAALLEETQNSGMIPTHVSAQLKAIQRLLEQADGEYREQIAAQRDADVARIVQENTAFLGMAIHELRTPMTNIRGYSDMLGNPAMAGELDPMQAQLLQVVQANSRRMESLLMDMAHINRLRGRRIQVNKKPDLFKNIALHVEKQTRPLAESLRRELVFTIPDGLPLLQTDGELLALALTRLIENGLRYSAEESGTVTVSASAQKDRLHISICDNGIGMDTDTLAKLGTLFFRADHNAVRQHKGSGLGTAIAYGLVELLGGTISVHSTPGKGTCFTLELEAVDEL